MRLFKRTNVTRLKWGFVCFFSNWSFTDVPTHPIYNTVTFITGKILWERPTNQALN